MLAVVQVWILRLVGSQRGAFGKWIFPICAGLIHKVLFRNRAVMTLNGGRGEDIEIYLIHDVLIVVEGSCVEGG